MQVLIRLSMAILLTFVAACGGGTTSPTAPSASNTMTGTWVGSLSDSSGSMMGAGMSTAMMSNATVTITQNGMTLSGGARFAGYPGGQMTFSGTAADHTGTFTMTAPTGSMSMMMGTCTATATGTFDMDDMMTQLHATYSGSNSCTGPFDHGQMSLTRR